MSDLPDCFSRKRNWGTGAKYTKRKEGNAVPLPSFWSISTGLGSDPRYVTPGFPSMAGMTCKPLLFLGEHLNHSDMGYSEVVSHILSF